MYVQEDAQIMRWAPVKQITDSCETARQAKVLKLPGSD